jgi:hypothetical protein
MSENTSGKRQTSMTFAYIGSLPTISGNNTGSNRSRRSSWSDSKVRNSNKKHFIIYLYIFNRKFGMLVMKVKIIRILVH